MQAFANLGIKPLDKNIEKLTEFVLQLYVKSRPKSVTSLGALRWYLFSKKQTESNKLPPTGKAIQQMMMHAHFTATQWKSSHLQHPNLPGPNNYEWKWDLNRETFDPIMTTKKQVCTEMCRCKDCKNTENDNYESDKSIWHRHG